MGCDIHPYLEVNIQGIWLYFCNVDLGRDYYLFSLLADVRNDGSVEPISKPKDLPEDCSDEIKKLIPEDDGDLHSHSYLSYDELKQAEKTYNKEMIRMNYKDKFPIDMRLFKEIKSKIPQVQAIRMVFAFDN